MFKLSFLASTILLFSWASQAVTDLSPFFGRLRLATAYTNPEYCERFYMMTSKQWIEGKPNSIEISGLEPGQILVQIQDVDEGVKYDVSNSSMNLFDSYIPRKAHRVYGEIFFFQAKHSQPIKDGWWALNSRYIQISKQGVNQMAISIGDYTRYLDSYKAFATCVYDLYPPQ